MALKTSALERRLEEAREVGKQWLWRGVLSIADQGLVSGSNFLLVIMFARWLAPGDYGAVSVGLSVFLLAANFHHALLLEPMSVLAPRRFAERRANYFAAVLRVHGGAVLALAVLLALVAAGSHAAAPALGEALLGLSLSTPLVLTFWVLRRICYVGGDPATALRGGAGFFACAGGGLVAVHTLGWRRAAAPFAVTGVAALGACAALLPAVRPRLHWDKSARGLLSEACGAHWSYGRWMVGVSLTYWLAHSAFAVLLSLSAGMSAAAELRALENLATPILQVTGALSLLLLPWVSGQTRLHGASYLGRYQRRAMLIAAAVTGGYLSGVTLFSAPLMRWLYGHHTYAALAGLAPIVAAATLVRGISDLSVSTALKAAARPDAHFTASLAAAILVLTGGWWTLKRWGVAGAAATMLASDLLQAGVLAAYFIGLTRAARGGRQ